MLDQAQFLGKNLVFFGEPVDIDRKFDEDEEDGQ